MARLNVILTPDEKNALLSLAECERRDPRAQAALIIRQDLERRGLLESPSQPLCNAIQGVAEAICDEKPKAAG